MERRFKAGQYMELSMLHHGSDSRGSHRVFSITSAPQQDDAVLRDIAARGQERDVVLVYVVRSEQEIAFRDELTELGIRVVLFMPSISGDAASDLPAGWTYVGAEAGAEELLAAVPDLKERKVLVSGSPSFIGGMRSEVRKAGVARVRTDAFLGY